MKSCLTQLLVATRYTSKSRSGFLILETLISVTLLALIVVSIFPSINFMLQRSKTSNRDSEASLLLQEGLEVSYNIFLSNWVAITTPGNYQIAVSIDADGNKKWQLVDGTETNINAKFTRSINIKEVCRDADKKVDLGCAVGSTIDPNSRIVIVMIEWDEGSHRTITGDLLLYNLSSF